MSDDAQRSLGELLAWLDRHINLEAIERGVAGRSAEPTLAYSQVAIDGIAQPRAVARHFPGWPPPAGQTMPEVAVA